MERIICLNFKKTLIDKPALIVHVFGVIRVCERQLRDFASYCNLSDHTVIISAGLESLTYHPTDPMFRYSTLIKFLKL